jgi:hypothetical protein
MAFASITKTILARGDESIFWVNQLFCFGGIEGCEFERRVSGDEFEVARNRYRE